MAKLVHSGDGTSDSEAASRSSAGGAHQPDGVMDDPDEPASSREEPPPSDAARCRVELVLLVDDVDPPLLGYVDRLLVRAADLLGIDRGRLTIAAVDDTYMATLHQQFKGIEGPTDVLTFDFRRVPGEPVEGDVVVCVDEARRQAVNRGHEVRAEVLLYAVHGLLHLLGYDDHEPDSAAAMHDREDTLLAALGVGRVYAAGALGTIGEFS